MSQLEALESVVSDIDTLAAKRADLEHEFEHPPKPPTPLRTVKTG